MVVDSTFNKPIQRHPLASQLPQEKNEHTIGEKLGPGTLKCGHGQHFQDIGHSFSLKGTLSQQIKSRAAARFAPMRFCLHRVRSHDSFQLSVENN